MKQNFLTIVVLIVSSVTLLIAAPAPAFANAQSDICTGIGASSSAQKGGTTCATSGPSVEHIINTIVKILSFVIGAVSIIMILFAGFRYVTSGGDANNIAAAKSTLIYAIVGLIVAALAQLLVNVVLSASTSVH